MSRKQLERGQRMVEVLKQPPYSPLAVQKQVVIIFAGAKGYLDDIPASKVVHFERDLYPFLESKYPQVLDNIQSKKVIDQEIESILIKAIEEYKLSFN